MLNEAYDEDACFELGLSGINSFVMENFKQNRQNNLARSLIEY